LKRYTASSGFTLIELSIVLVIIGLIVGGVLVGKDLIGAAEVRATISQIEKYNTAVNTFRGKYGYLPGDIPDPAASQFGFQARGQYPGEGDGNGVLEGVYSDAPDNNWANQQSAGETPMFWVDLSAAFLIDSGFHTASTHVVPGSPITTSSSPGLNDYLPQAKLGRGNYVVVWSYNGTNYFSIQAVSEIFNAVAIQASALNITVQQAYGIDKKMDDGLPQTGNVTASYLGGIPSWVGPSDTSATAGSSTTCYDNGNSGGAQQQYSLEINGGAGANCALSFRFQ
jgi:prepilin-type N-terminal cleavage/methylation domain-containing protein